MIKNIEAITYDFQGDLFIDIGGNLGMWTTQLVDLYDKVIFIEPSDMAITEAKKRIQAVCDQKNVSFTNIDFRKNICSDAVGLEKSIYATTQDTGNFSIYAKDLYGANNVTMAEEKIPTITLDSLADVVGDAKKILIKIDTEGSDLDILLGGFEFIKQFKPTLIVEAHYHMYFDEKKHKKIFDYLFDLGYELTEFKYPSYQQNPTYIYDGVRNGLEMYDCHFQMLLEPTE